MVLSWILQLMGKLEVCQRTLELTLLFVDNVLSSEFYAGLNTEAVVLACAILIIKLEGDFTAHYSDFLHFVLSNPQFSQLSLPKLEAQIIGQLPTGFPFVSTLSEFTNLIISIDGLTSQCSLSQLALQRIVLNRFIEFDGWRGIMDLIVSPVLMSIGSTAQRRCAFRKVVHQLKHFYTPKARAWKRFEQFLSVNINRKPFVNTTQYAYSNY